MTSQNITNPKKSENKSKFTNLIAKTPVHIAVVLIALIWTLPTVGLLISSFRPSADYWKLVGGRFFCILLS